MHVLLLLRKLSRGPVGKRMPGSPSSFHSHITRKTRARLVHTPRQKHKWPCQGPKVCARTPGAKSLEHKQPSRSSPRNRMFRYISNYHGLWAGHPLLTTHPPSRKSNRISLRRAARPSTRSRSYILKIHSLWTESQSSLL